MNTNEENKEQKINVEGEEKVTVDETTEESAQNGQDDSQEETQEKDPLEAAIEQIEELKDKYLRAVAEFDNYKKRTLKEKTELILNGGEKTIVAILPILDDMERAAASAEKTDDIKALEEGWELIFKKLKEILESMGVKEIETKDADFNVDFHEAIAMVPGMGDDKKGKVIDCVQTGYTMNDKVIRQDKKDIKK